MRSYREYCAVARSLDVVGDRWSLLIVRELALRGVCRYKDLQDGLPGISTNLLADRLRELEQADVIRKHEPGPPIATPVFELTEHGRGLEPILRSLMGWGMRYMVSGPAPTDAFFGRWLAWPADTFLVDGQPEADPIRVAFEAEGESIHVTAEAGQITVTPSDDQRADARVVGSAHTVLALIAGYIDLDRAADRGVSYNGSRAAIERLLPTVFAVHEPGAAPDGAVTGSSADPKSATNVESDGVDSRDPSSASDHQSAA